jgi:Ca-activated chloride channel family protein
MFTITAHYTPYLYLGQDTMQAAFTLKVAENTVLAPVPLALAIALDRSGSMSGAKFKKACDSAIKVIQMLDEQVIFMVLCFDSTTSVVSGPIAARAQAKQHAIQAIQHMRADGGTRMSTALDAAVAALRLYRESHTLKMLFLTDGRNEGEQRPVLDAAIQRCSEVRMSIHAWGVGTDWDADELRHMADVTHGSADIIPMPEQIEAAFTQSFACMRSTALDNVRLILWMPMGVAIKHVQQVYPNLVTLDAQPNPQNARQRLVSLGSFAVGEQRDCLVELVLPVYTPGQSYVMLRPSVRYATVDGEQEENAPRESWVIIQWTGDAAQAAQIDPHIAHYTNEKVLADHIKNGNEALARGERQQAAEQFAQALQISRRTGNEKMTKLLSTIVVEAPDGTAVLRDIDRITLKTLEVKEGTTSKFSS